MKDLEHDSISSGDSSREYYFDKIHDVASRRELSRPNRRCNKPRSFRARTSPSRNYSRLGKGDSPGNSRRQLALYQTTSLANTRPTTVLFVAILLGTTTNESRDQTWRNK